MLRRRLALYTLFYIAGITAGFFLLEKNRIAEAAGFSAAVISAVILTEPGSKSRPFISEKSRHGKSQAGKHLNLGNEVIKGQKRILVMLFMAGALLFSLRYLVYSSETASLCSVSSISQSGDQVEGKVVSVTCKEESVRLIIRKEGDLHAKVLVVLDRKTAEKSLLQDDSMNDDLPDFANVYGCTGAMVKAKGEYSELSSADNPGCFDYSLYMKSKGVTAGFKADSIEVIDGNETIVTGIRRYLYATRESFIRRFDEETAGFIRGVIFGDKSEIDDDILDEFNSNSTGHILAVSGLHIGFLYGLLRFLTSHRKTMPVSMMIIALILLYGEMTMWSPATVRACIVLTVSLLSAIVRRRSDLLTSISLAAFLILSFQPYQLFNSGFQLSFLALCGISFLTNPIASVTGETIAVMLAVQIGTLPVIAYSFCSINPLSILINVPVILLSSLLVPLCILMLIIQVIVGMTPEAGFGLAELISFAIIKINHILGFGGSFSIRTAGPGAAAIILIYVFVFGLSSEWTRVMLLRKGIKTVFKQGILLLMPLLMLFSCLFNPLSDDEIVFVAVGQGDCTHIRASGHDMLIDGGGQKAYNSDSRNSSDSGNEDSRTSDKDNEGNRDGFNVGKSILMPYLLHSGAENIDMALVTHLHTDHYKGINELSEIFPVGAIGIPIDYRGSVQAFEAQDSGNQNSDMRASDSVSAEVIYIKPDTKIELSDDVYIEAIWPAETSEEPLAADDPNEHNTVYMINYKGIKTMITGDLLEEDEKEMVDFYKDTDVLNCDILKVAHHGSKSSSSETFLDAASPSIAVIQCGRNNIYGHPHQQTLERLEERGIKVYRTDLNGAVGIDLDGAGISINSFK